VEVCVCLCVYLDTLCNDLARGEVCVCVCVCVSVSVCVYLDTLCNDLARGDDCIRGHVQERHAHHPSCNVVYT
jgi:hypothetical protein